MNRQDSSPNNQPPTITKEQLEAMAEKAESLKIQSETETDPNRKNILLKESTAILWEVVAHLLADLEKSNPGQAAKMRSELESDFAESAEAVRRESEQRECDPIPSASLAPTGKAYPLERPYYQVEAVAS